MSSLDLVAQLLDAQLEGKASEVSSAVWGVTEVESLPREEEFLPFLSC
jgi:hypothetical protein